MASGRQLAMRFRAVRVHEFGAPSVLKVEDSVSLPFDQLGAKHVLIRYRAAGVNPVETYQRSGVYAALPSLPYTPGKDGGGVVESVGADVTHVKPGDRVATFGSLTGSYAQYGVSDESTVIKIPDSMSFEQGASVGIPYTTAYRALFVKGAGAAGKTVLVHGASGGVGTAAVQLARLRGMTVLGTASTSEGRDLVTRLGAHRVFDHSKPGYTDEIMRATDNKGVDIIVENAAHINLGADAAMVAQNGRIVVVGSRGEVSIDPRNLMRKEAMVVGVMLFAATVQELADSARDLEDIFATSNVAPVVGETFAMNDAPRAHEAVIANAKAGKIVLALD